MFCIECGKEYSEEVNFCSKCGTDLTPHHETIPELKNSGFSDVQSAKKNPIIKPVINKENSVRNDQNQNGSTHNETESMSHNPETSWQDEKEYMKHAISQLEYENQKLWEKNEKLTKTLPPSKKPTKKTGLPRPQIKSSENMWNKFKKWYNE